MSATLNVRLGAPIGLTNEIASGPEWLCYQVHFFREPRPSTTPTLHYFESAITEAQEIHGGILGLDSVSCRQSKFFIEVAKDERYWCAVPCRWPLVRWTAGSNALLFLLHLVVAGLVTFYPQNAAAASLAGSRAKLKIAIRELLTCEQLVTVTTNSWDDVNATVNLYERSADGRAAWRRFGNPFPAVVGQHGLAWGIGLHGTGEPGEPEKREGDRRAPAGVFRFGTVFGTARPEQVRFLRLPYLQVTTTTEAIDDPKSKYYNHVVDRRAVTNADWASSESMLQVGGRYRLGLVIGHNAAAYPGFGSCIFFHVWDPKYPGTTGCTATSYDHLVRLLRWLDPKKNPLIVQLPAGEYERLKQRWGLPALSE